jgi:ACR3 family arsenite efflux pump ArsB
MMYPILCKIKYETLHLVFAHRQIWIQIGFSIVLNWIVAPLFMVSQMLISMSWALCTYAIMIWSFGTNP